MTRVLVVDDSATMRRVMQVIFNSTPGFEVHVAKSGEEALEMIPRIRPDVVTLDIILTGMDGLVVLEEIMSRHPLPVVMVSGLTSEGTKTSLDALSIGAVDIIAKPMTALTGDLEPFRSDVINRVTVAAQAGSTMAQPSPASATFGHASVAEPYVPAYFPIVLVGSSTGGPPALEKVLSKLSGDFPAAVVIAQHMPAEFTSALAERLNRAMSISVAEVTSPVMLRPGHVYIAKGDADLVFERSGDRVLVKSVESDGAQRWHPSVERMVQSAGDIIDVGRLIGVMLTGMGDDGAKPLAELQRRGARTIAESQESAVVWGMPGALVKAGGAGKVLPADEIGGALWALTR